MEEENVDIKDTLEDIEWHENQIKWHEEQIEREKASLKKLRELLLFLTAE